MEIEIFVRYLCALLLAFAGLCAIPKEYKKGSLFSPATLFSMSLVFTTSYLLVT